MTSTLLAVVDEIAQVLWVAFVQFTLFGAALLVPIWIWHRRPAVRHHLALAAVTGALLSPIAAACSLRFAFDWAPVPPWALPGVSDARMLTHPEEPRESTADSLSDNETRTTNRRFSSPSRQTDQSEATPVPASVITAQDGISRPASADTAQRATRPARANADATTPPAITATPPPPERTQGQHTQATSSPAVPVPALSPSVTAHRISRTLLAVWLLGVLLGAARDLRIRVRLRRLLRDTTPVHDRALLSLAERTAVGVGLTTPPRLLRSGTVTNPFVTGLFRPRIVLPEFLATSGDDSSLRHVLLHECWHIARRDLWFGALQRCATLLGWPHPLVHAHARILSQAREELCDNRVLEHTSPPEYSRTLLRLSERSSGLLPLSATSLFRHREPLARRIARLLDPRRDRTPRLNWRHRLLLLLFVAAAATAVAGIHPGGTGALRAGEGPPAQPAAERTPPDTEATIRELAERSAPWIAAPSGVKLLEYEFVSGGEATAVKVRPGERRRFGVWIGTTLHGGFRELVRSPERFHVEVTRKPDAKTISVIVRPKDQEIGIRVEAGNGVENSWRGYFSHGARETEITVDAERLVPLEERSGQTTFRYSEWQEVRPGKWVPLQVDVQSAQTHWRMRFAWLADAVWLLKSSESVSPQGSVTLARTRNVRIDGRPVTVPETEEERRSREAAGILRAMLEGNRPWLDPGQTGAGWKPPFETLSYTFHTVREDVREACVLESSGRAVFEVTGDSQGKMKDQLGNRKIALNTEQHATSERGARFARIYGRPERLRDQPSDLALQHYARIGCQFDLPLFRYRERLNTATVAVEGGDWNGRPCRVATVSNLGGGIYLGYGTMLGFTSWSYVHHIAPAKEVIYIDPERNVPLHETLTSARDGRTFEVDFADFVEVEPGQWAPLSIRIEAKDYFTCEYRFQLVAERHWMLKKVTSWFKPENKSRGVVENVQVNGGREFLEQALRQVEATRQLFGGAAEPDRKFKVAVVPFALGEKIELGPYVLRVTLSDVWTVVVTVSTQDADASSSVPLVFLDENMRPLFAPSVQLEAEDGIRQGSIRIHGSEEWRDVRWIAAPSIPADAKRLPIRVVPLRWGEDMPVNIPDTDEGESRRYEGVEAPREARTRAFRVRTDRADNSSVKLTLDLVSIDGPQEFRLDLAAALLDGSGRLLASGHHSDTLRVVSEPVERRFELELGQIPASSNPALLAIGIAPGDVISAPIGSTWGTFLDDRPPFEIADLLAAPDDSTRLVGLVGLGNQETDRSIEKEFFDERLDERRVGDGPYSRRTLLKPHVEVLNRILRDSDAPEVQSAAIRFLAYSEADGAAEVLEPFAAAQSLQVRDVAAIGLTFLGRDGHLDRLREILGQDAPSWENEAAARRAYSRIEQDVLIALAHQGGDAAVDLLGETLTSDLDDLRVQTSEHGRPFLDGPVSRARNICTLLGRSGNERAVTWLWSAADRIARRAELSEQFGLSGVAASLMRYPEQTAERIAARLKKGDAPAAWMDAVRESRDPAFVPAVAAMLRREDVTSNTAYDAVVYLWNLGSPGAVEVLRGMYDRGTHKAHDRTWLTLCKSLAAAGDARGLADAYETLVELEQPAEPPADEKERRNWTRAREDLREDAEEVFGRASKEMVAEFLAGKAGASEAAERRVVLTLLWRIPELPPQFSKVLPQWSESTDRTVAESARRLLERD